MYEHFKRNHEDSVSKNKILSDRLLDQSLEYQKCFDELAIFKQEYVGYETSTNQKGDIIDSLKDKSKGFEQKIKFLEE